jgi:uncharacterized BrkB/YihY/UPF0761 family membrane protein
MPPESPEPPSRLTRARLWTAAAQARAQQVAERTQEERTRHRSLDAVFEMVDRDGEVGGGIIAGALAYRLFIWLLPLALVLVAGLGIAADAASESPRDAAGSLGMRGLVSKSIADAAQGPGRWYALVVGVPVLVYTTRSVLRVLISAHRLVWLDVRAAAPRPTVVATLRLLALLLCVPVVTAVASAVRAWSTGPGVLVTLASTAAFAAIWLAVVVRLPHRDADRKALVPGALVFGVGAEVLHTFVAYVLGPYAIAKQGTYGALGAAAALLFGLYLISRLIVGAAVVNATLWDRRSPP